MSQRLSVLIFGAIFSLSVCVKAADAPRPVRLEQTLIGPELVMRHIQDLGLDEAQQKAIQEEMIKMREKFGALQGELQQQVATLNEMLQQPAADEQKTLAQLDKVLDVERDIKHLRLSMALSIRGKLTADQQAKVRDLQEKMVAQDRQGGADGPPPTVQQKMQHLSELMQHARQDGRDIPDLKPIMEELSNAMHQRKFEQAEALADKAIKVLEEGQKK